MELDVIMSAISTVGFPIVCSLGLFYVVEKRDQRYLEETTKRDELHREEINSLKTSLDNNTVILTKLYENIVGGNANE